MHDRELLQLRVRQAERVRKRLRTIEPIVEADGGASEVDFTDDGRLVHRLRVDRRFLFGMTLVLRWLEDDVRSTQPEKSAGLEGPEHT